MTGQPSIWDEIEDSLGERLAADLRNLARLHEEGAERSQQRDLGPSQIGNPCTRCLARAVLGIPVVRDFDDPWCRIIGTATHEWLDTAAGVANITAQATRWWPEKRVHPDPELLPSGGKADLYDTETFTVIDHKIVGANPLKKYKADGPGPQYRIQAHVYGLGYVNAGRRVDHVAVAFWLRGGRLADLYVWTEPYDEAIARNALTRYRTIRDQARTLGAAILPHLPADSACWDCRGAEMSAEELAAITTHPNPANVA